MFKPPNPQNESSATKLCRTVIDHLNIEKDIIYFEDLQDNPGFVFNEIYFYFGETTLRMASRWTEYIMDYTDPDFIAKTECVISTPDETAWRLLLESKFRT